jgi:hypothetical protein
MIFAARTGWRRRARRIGGAASAASICACRTFRWRQAAIDAHDRHHLITGYELTLTGEIQLAAWEWGAGRYPDWRATLFCSPLIVAGIAAMPVRTWRAFRRGRGCTSLYAGTASAVVGRTDHEP